MKVFVFAGPTLTRDEARTALDAEYLPPVSQGDVYRVARHRPAAIGIIDGYFERIPAVWHKEILWAMSQGIHVYGAASMGALRAAELEPFGMVGVGWIFNAFRDGLLEDDDEVAVAHTLADGEYRPQSEALVNIRRTLAAAEAAAVIDANTHGVLIRAAKRTYYPERDYARLLSQWIELQLSGGQGDRLAAWLPLGRIDQKRQDAMEMLRVMRRHLDDRPTPKQVSFTFEHTVWWDRAISYAGAVDTPVGSAGDTMLLLDSVLDELRLQGAYRSAHDGAALRLLSLGESRRQGLSTTAETLRVAATGFCTTLGIDDAAALERWLAENHLTADDFDMLMRDEALIARARMAVDGEVIARVVDHLRATGKYGSLAARARAKRQVLDAHGLENPGLEDAGIAEDELLRWYYNRINRDVPSDLASAAYEAGFENADALRFAVLREFCYLRLTQHTGTS